MVRKSGEFYSLLHHFSVIVVSFIRFYIWVLSHCGWSNRVAGLLHNHDNVWSTSTMYSGTKYLVYCCKVSGVLLQSIWCADTAVTMYQVYTVTKIQFVTKYMVYCYKYCCVSL